MTHPLLVALVLLPVASGGGAPSALAHGGSGGGIHAEHATAAPAAEDTTPVVARAGEVAVAAPWSRAAIAGGTGAGFLALRNEGTAPDRLLSAASPVARTVELHTHIRDGDVMRMRPVPSIALPPGETVTLGPGGLHIMLIGLAEALRPGTTVPLTLTFERGGTVTVPLAVQAATSRGPTGAAAPAHRP